MHPPLFNRVVGLINKMEPDALHLHHIEVQASVSTWAQEEGIPELAANQCLQLLLWMQEELADAPPGPFPTLH